MSRDESNSLPLRDLSVNSPNALPTPNASKEGPVDGYEMWATLKRIDELFVLITKFVAASRAATMLLPNQNASLVAQEYARVTLRDVLQEYTVLVSTPMPDYAAEIASYLTRVVDGPLRTRLLYYQTALPDQTRRLQDAVVGLASLKQQQQRQKAQRANSGSGS